MYCNITLPVAAMTLVTDSSNITWFTVRSAMMTVDSITIDIKQTWTWHASKVFRMPSLTQGSDAFLKLENDFRFRVKVLAGQKLALTTFNMILIHFLPFKTVNHRIYIQIPPCWVKVSTENDLFHSQKLKCLFVLLLHREDGDDLYSWEWTRYRLQAAYLGGDWRWWFTLIMNLPVWWTFTALW